MVQTWKINVLFDNRLPQRFWNKIEQGENGCWLWTAQRCRGYAIFRYKGKSSKAHRAAYLVLVGDIPDGLQCDHLCRVPHCVNPEHIELVTPGENTRRYPGCGINQTHCKHGHEFTEANTYRWRGKYGIHRHCRACQSERDRRRNR